MSKPKQLIVSLLIGAILTACQQGHGELDGVMLFKLSDIEEMRSPYHLSQIIPLETTNDNLLGEYLKVKMKGDDIFIYDENARDAIHHFDKKGRYLGRVVEVGEGPEMVNNINDFVPTEAGLEVLIGMGEFSKILVFDKNFKLDKEIELDYQGSSFEILPDGKYVLSGSYNLPFVEHRVALLNAAGETLKAFLPNDYSNKMIPMEERNFHNEDGKVFFHEVFNPVAYEVSEDSLLAKVRFDFENYAIPAKFWEMDIMDGFEMINKNGFANIFSYWENESIAFFEIYVEKNVHDGGGTENHQIIWDKKNERANRRIFSKEQNPAFYSPIGLIGDRLVFVAQAAYMPDLKTDISTEGIHKDDNPVLLFVDF